MRKIMYSLLQEFEVRYKAIRAIQDVVSGAQDIVPVCMEEVDIVQRADTCVKQTETVMEDLFCSIREEICEAIKSMDRKQMEDTFGFAFEFSYDAMNEVLIKYEERIHELDSRLDIFTGCLRRVFGGGVS